MRLTNFSDYGLRILIYAATCSDRLITIDEASIVYGIPRNHLSKIARQLTRAGIMKSVRGRSGGLTLARDAKDIRLGDILRITEPNFAIAECFLPQESSKIGCRITSSCRLKGALHEALNSFMSTVDKYTLADMVLSSDYFDK